MRISSIKSTDDTFYLDDTPKKYIIFISLFIVK